MGELDVVRKTERGPATVDSLAASLRALGVTSGQLLLVHSSLSSLGWVSGGPVAVILALEQVLGTEGTLVMPTHSGDLSDPALWEDPPVPESWWETIRRTMPAYDGDLTPSRGMGIIAETFRKQRGVIRSGHPQVSFAARGAMAESVTSGHALDYGLGEDSPLGRIYHLKGLVLLLGVGHATNTSLHLAEYRAAYPGKRESKNHAPIMLAGRREWVTARDIELDCSDFERIGESFERSTGKVRRGRVGDAVAQLMPQRDLVDSAAAWMEQHRGRQSRG